MEIFVIDSWNWPVGYPPASRIIETGGGPQNWSPWAPGVGQIVAPGRWGASGGAVNPLFYPTIPTTADYTIEADFEMYDDVNTSRLALFLRAPAGAFTMFLATYLPNLQQWFLEAWNNGAGVGTAVAAATTPAPCVIHVALSVAGTIATLTVNGNAIATLNNAAVTGPQHAGIQTQGTASATTGGAIRNVIVHNFPILPRRLITDPDSHYYEYTPPTTAALSSLTLWTQPRNIVWKDIAADAIWAWRRGQTPTDLQF